MIELNFVYADHPGPRTVVFENSVGKVYMSSSHNGNIANVAMNTYSASGFVGNDSIFVAEPICVLAENYNTSLLNKFRYIFAWDTKAFENTTVANKVVYVNFPSYRNNPTINSSNWPSWSERADEIVFIANNKSSRHPSELYSLRVKLADWLNANSKFNVSWYGNMAINRPYYKGRVSDKQEILRKAKFSVCIENSYDARYSHNFLTEKLPDVWFSGAAPIYMGCSNMSELGVNPGSYIDLLPFRNDFGGITNLLESYTEENYKELTTNILAMSDQLYRLTSYENMFSIMIDTYAKA